MVTLFGWTIQRKPKANMGKCLKCGVPVNKDVAPQMKFKYIEDGAPKMGVEFLCDDCASELDIAEEENGSV